MFWYCRCLCKRKGFSKSIRKQLFLQMCKLGDVLAVDDLALHQELWMQLSSPNIVERLYWITVRSLL